MTEIGLLTLIIRTGSPKRIGIEYRNTDGRINSNDDSPKCGPVRGCKILILERRGKITYPTNYLRMYWTDLHQIFLIFTHMGESD